MSKLKEMAKDVAQQAVKIFFIWAIIAGPLWAQNLTQFALTLCVIGMAILGFLGIVAGPGIRLKAEEDKAWARERLKDKKHWIYNISSFVLLGTMAAYGWFWIGGTYAVTWLLLYIIQEGSREIFQEVLGDEVDSVRSTSG